MLEDLVVQAKMTDSMQAPGEMEKQALARIWREALKSVPTGDLEPCFYAAIAHDQHRTPRPQEVLAAWNRTLIAAPRETFQEVEAREEAARGFKALLSHDDDRPISYPVHRDLGRCVVCFCTYGAGLSDRHSNRKYADGVQRAAEVAETASGPRYRCAIAVCDFDIDAEDADRVRAASVLPIVGAAIPAPATPAAAPATVTQTRAELLADEAEILWAECDAAQRDDLAKFARWCDWMRPPRVVTPLNFVQVWDEWMVKREAAA